VLQADGTVSVKCSGGTSYTVKAPAQVINNPSAWEFIEIDNKPAWVDRATRKKFIYPDGSSVEDTISNVVSSVASAISNAFVGPVSPYTYSSSEFVGPMPQQTVSSKPNTITKVVPTNSPSSPYSSDFSAVYAPSILSIKPGESTQKAVTLSLSQKIAVGGLALVAVLALLKFLVSSKGE
jgi:hypothetical protein